MVIGDFTAGELPIPANTEYGEGSLKVIERQGHVHPPTCNGRIALIGDDVEADLGGGAVELGLWILG